MDLKTIVTDYNNTQFSKEQRSEYKKMNIHDILSLIKKEFDSEAQAKKCHEKYYDIEGHKYYHMTEAEIIKSWNEKGAKTRQLGNKIDEYIQLILNGATEKEIKLYRLDNDINNEPVLKGKCDAVELLLNNLKKLKLERVLQEEPLYFKYKDYIFSGREDCIFKGKDRYVLVDWKSSKVNTQNNYGSKMFGPLKDFDDCNYIEYTLQIYFYKYFLIHTYNITDPIDTYIIEFRLKDDVSNIGEYYVYKPAFEYNEELIEKVIEYAINKKEILN